jgi:hypothetical protein
MSKSSLMPKLFLAVGALLGGSAESNRRQKVSVWTDLTISDAAL